MTALPRAIAALWGLDEEGRRGPKRTLSVAGIGEAAVRIADAEGLAAVSMASVAKELGTTAMALYRYVASRQELEAVMADVAIGPPPDFGSSPDWTKQLFNWAWEEARQLAAHPWALEVRPGSPPVSPNLTAWTDAGMQIMLRSGLPEQPAASCLLMVDGYVRSHLMLGLQFSDAEATAQWGEQLRLVVDPERMPGLHRVLESGAFEDGDGPPGEFPGEDFEFGLAVLLDGFRALAARG
jgi:AcrR family transcriptional regulator